MLTTLETILRQSWQRLGDQIQVLLPNLLAMLLILAAGWVVARVAQWALERTGRRMESRLRQWGFAGSHGHTVARGVFWVIFGCAILMGINVLNTQLGSVLATNAFLYLPRLLTAAFVFLGGLLLARFLARGALIWAVNEGIGAARLIAGGVRIGVIFLASVGAMEQLGVARSAVLATFI